MRSSRLRAFSLSLGLTALLCGCATGVLSGHRGRQEAARDLEQGFLAVKSCGYPVWPFWYYRDRLEPYGILATNLGCNPRLRRYVNGYNAVSERAIAQQYGSNFLAEVWRESERDFASHSKVLK
jgi:hypothetical protein